MKLKEKIRNKLAALKEAIVNAKGITINITQERVTVNGIEIKDERRKKIIKDQMKTAFDKANLEMKVAFDEMDKQMNEMFK
jgi:hypothetical protein